MKQRKIESASLYHRPFKEAALSRGNASTFVEDTIRLYLQFEKVVERLSTSKNPSKRLLEEFEDLLDSVTINMRRHEESIPASDVFKKIWDKRK